jgi:chromosome partitioning protein
MGPKIVVLANEKGGAGKTAGAIGLSEALSDRGRTGMVDADPQGTGWQFCQAANGALSFRCVSAWPVETAVEHGLPAPELGAPGVPLSATIRHFAEGWDFVIVDTPPGNLEIVRQAIAAGTEVLLPVAPSSSEVRQLRVTLRLIASINPELPVAVLLNRVKANTVLGRDVRADLDRLQIPRLEAVIPEREWHRAAWGTSLRDLAKRHGDPDFYAAVAEELLAEELVAE